MEEWLCYQRGSGGEGRTMEEHNLRCRRRKEGHKKDETLCLLSARPIVVKGGEGSSGVFNKLLPVSF